MRKVLFAVAAFIICVAAQTTAAFSAQRHTITQPDGTRVEVILRGGEMYMEAASRDGYTLIRDKETGYVCYAIVSADGREYLSTGIAFRGGDAPEEVRRITKPGQKISKERRTEIMRERMAQTGNTEREAGLRAGKTLPDTIVGLCLMVEFDDVSFEYSPQEVDTFLNGEKETVFGNSMSVKKYFQWISGGRLTYINKVSKKIFHCPKPFEYYSPADADEYTSDRLLDEVITGALLAINEEEDGFDLNALTRDENGFLAINILYAGDGPEKWGTGLWPHRGWHKFYLVDYGIPYGTKQTYQMSCSGKDSLNLGTFIHENCHMLLDFPDFYSFEEENDDNNAATYNIGETFGVSDKHKPDYPNPYSLDLLGWLDNKQDITNINGGELVTLKEGVGNAAVYYGDGNNAAERYYLEIRDHHLGNHLMHEEQGVFIWHVNAKGNNNYSGYDELLDCRPATLENCMWTASNGPAVFSDESEPSARWVDGAPSGLYLWEFSEAGSEMTFRVGRNEERELRIVTERLADGVAEEEYMAIVRADGGDYHYTFSDADGTLPSGLRLSPDGIITGMVMEMTDDSVRIQVSDGAGATAEKTLYIYIDEAEREIVASKGYNVQFEEGAKYQKQLEASGGYGNFKFALKDGSFPPGIEMDEEGLISGISEVADTFVAVVEITSNGATHTAKAEMTITMFVMEKGSMSGSPTDEYPLTLAQDNVSIRVGEVVCDSIRVVDPGYGNLTFTVMEDSDMPAGISIGEDGKISGKAEKEGLYLVGVKVTSMKGDGAYKSRTVYFYFIVGKALEGGENSKVIEKVAKTMAVRDDADGGGFVISGAAKGSVCTVISIMGTKVEEFVVSGDEVRFGKRLAKGVYVLRIKSGDGEKVMKLMRK